jgi:cbb3-type cytochrome oxidase maturation protein
LEKPQYIFVTDLTMQALLILILASLAVASLFLLFFIKATTEGQFEDTESPSARMLGDDYDTYNKTKTDNE